MDGLAFKRITAVPFFFFFAFPPLPFSFLHLIPYLPLSLVFVSVSVISFCWFLFTWSFLEYLLIYLTCICRIVYRNTLNLLRITVALSRLLKALAIPNHFSSILEIEIIWNWPADSEGACPPLIYPLEFSCSGYQLSAGRFKEQFLFVGATSQF